VVDPGQTLLDAGLAAGLPMPYSCTVGSCGDCRVRLRGGDVAQNEPNCLTPQQRAAGYVLTCVGSPLSKVTLDIAEPGPDVGISANIGRKEPPRVMETPERTNP
jgi:ferredoxin